MAFNRKNQADIDALWAEVTIDPAGVGYNQNQTRNIVNGLNLKSRNPGTERAPVMFTPRLILTHVVPGQIDDADFSTDGRARFVDWLAHISTLDLDENLDEFRSKFLNALPAGSGKDDLTAADEKLSRGEVFFADNRYYEFSKADWIAARDGHS